MPSDPISVGGVWSDSPCSVTSCISWASRPALLRRVRCSTMRKDTHTMEVIKTTTRTGFADDDRPIHRHTQLYTLDGTLIVELCDSPECETLDLPAAWGRSQNE